LSVVKIVVAYLFSPHIYSTIPAATPTTAIPAHSIPFSPRPRVAAPELWAGAAEPVELPPDDIVVVGEFDLEIPLEALALAALPLAVAVSEPVPAAGPFRNEVSAVAVEKMLT